MYGAYIGSNILDHGLKSFKICTELILNNHTRKEWFINKPYDLKKGRTHRYDEYRKTVIVRHCTFCNRNIHFRSDKLNINYFSRALAAIKFSTDIA